VGGDRDVRFGWNGVDDFVEMKSISGCPYEFHLLRKSELCICTWFLTGEVGWPLVVGWLM
jgi:hypothetical protein